MQNYSRMKTIIKTENAPAPIGPYNQAVLAGDTLYVSGQIALDPKTGELHTQNIELETEWVMKNLGAVLNAAGMNYDNIAKCSIFINDINCFIKSNQPKLCRCNTSLWKTNAI